MPCLQDIQAALLSTLHATAKQIYQAKTKRACPESAIHARTLINLLCHHTGELPPQVYLAGAEPHVQVGIELVFVHSLSHVFEMKAGCGLRRFKCVNANVSPPPGARGLR